jgi:outer membrane lipoprotein-sorting protein
MSHAILLLICLLLQGIVHGQDAAIPVTGEAKAAFLQHWGERLQAMRSLHMVFTQEKHLQLLRRPLLSQGELWLKGDTLRYVLKHTAGDIELELRLDAQTVKTYYPLTQTLEVIGLRTTQAPFLSIPFLGRDPTALVKEYDSELSVDAERYTLRLMPRHPDTPLAEIRLILQDFLPQEFLQVEKSGNRTLMRISTFTPNPEVSDAQLELQIPPGTKVTYPLGKP